MRRISSWLMVIVAVVLGVLGGMALAQQDKYTVQVPNGLALSECRGYDDWPALAASYPESENKLNVIVANLAMIGAYRAGVPGDGKQFPDGSKTVKITWKAKQHPEAPFPVKVPDTLAGIGCMVKDSRRFPDSGGWGYAQFDYNPASGASRPTHLNRGTTPRAGSPAMN